MSYKGMVCIAEFLQEVILISETISYKVTWRKRRQESQEEPISEWSQVILHWLSFI